MITGKTTQDLWFDNWMAKPPLIDKSSPYSVLVFFEVSDLGPVKQGDSRDGYYCGQFDYNKRLWDVVPSPFEVHFGDQYVIKWMHIPDGAAYDKKGTNNV
jgi:hypothetical protein